MTSGTDYRRGSLGLAVVLASGYFADRERASKRARALHRALRRGRRVSDKTYIAESDVRPPERPYSELGDLDVMRFADNYNQALLELVLAHGRSPAVDFGAGKGTHALNCRMRGFEVTCVEPDATFQSELRESGFETVSSLSDLPGRSFPFAYSFNVLEHIEDDGAALRELLAVLEPGGRLLIYVPAFPILYGPMDQAVGHHRRYTKNSLTAKLLAAGFEVEQSGYMDSLGFVAAYLYRWVGNKNGQVTAEQVKFFDRYVFPMSRTFDRAASGFLGKNVFALATKPGAVGSR